MPEAAVIKNICSAADATGTGNFAVRAMSWMMPRSFTKISTALRGVAVEHMRHAVLEHPGIAGGRRDHFIDLPDIEALPGGKGDRFRGGGDMHAGEQLVDHLERGALTCGIAEFVEFCRHRIQRGPRFLESRGTARCQNGELALRRVLCAA